MVLEGLELGEYQVVKGITVVRSVLLFDGLALGSLVFLTIDHLCSLQGYLGILTLDQVELDDREAWVLVAQAGVDVVVAIKVVNVTGPLKVYTIAVLGKDTLDGLELCVSGITSFILTHLVTVHNDQAIELPLIVLTESLAYIIEYLILICVEGIDELIGMLEGMLLCYPHTGEVTEVEGYL